MRMKLVPKELSDLFHQYPGHYFVYGLLRPDSDVPFWVGTTTRWDVLHPYALRRRGNKKRKEAIEKILQTGQDVIIQFYKITKDHEAALDKKEELINLYSSNLTNIAGRQKYTQNNKGSNLPQRKIVNPVPAKMNCETELAFQIKLPKEKNYSIIVTVEERI